MLKNKIFYSIAILALCASALVSCTGNQTTESESHTSDNIVSDIKEGMTDIESDIKDGGIGDREDATHGSDEQRARNEETSHHREAVPFGK